MKKHFAGAVVSLALVAAPALAQTAGPGEPVQNFKYEVAVAGGGEGGPLDRIVMVRAEESFEARVVKGVPYQAEAVNEFVQTLADGNRIVARSTSTVARDGEGRTRREHGLAAIGPMLAGGPEARTVFINDPVAGVSWILEPSAKVARKLVRPAGAAGTITGANTQPLAGDKDQPRGERIVIRGPGEPGGRFKRALPQGETESLGTKVIEGVEATGTRTTITIPAGEIGNERPFVILSERWFAPDLNAVVLSRHSDPRSGESTFRLTQINRGEPDRSLFEVPSDYTVKEGGPGHEMRIERRIQRPQ